MDADGALVRAVAAGDLVGTREALQAGADPCLSLDDYAKTPLLTAAARQGAEDIVAALLAAGAEPNVQTPWEWTPLRAAATFGRAGVVGLLLAAGADPNPPSQRGSILMDALAATRHWPTPHSLETVRILLDAGATVRAEDDPAVVLAVASATPPAALGVLLDHGADPNATRSDGTPAIVIAAMRRNTAAVDRLLAAGAEVDAADAHGRTALMHAVERGADGIVAALLCAGADKDRQSDDGSSAHSLAVAWGRGNLRLMMGEQSVGRAIIDTPRHVIDQRASVVQLLGDHNALDQLAMLIDHALLDLGDEEFETLIGATEDSARDTSHQLRTAQTLYEDSRTLRVVDVTRDQHLLIRDTLLNLAYGPSMPMPSGMTRAQLADLFADFDGFLP